MRAEQSRVKALQFHAYMLVHNIDSIVLSAHLHVRPAPIGSDLSPAPSQRWPSLCPPPAGGEGQSSKSQIY